MTYEFDGFHAATAMAGTVQPVFHQSDPADVGGLGADDGHPRARSAASPASRTGRRCRSSAPTTGLPILLTYGPNRDWLKNIVSAGGGRMRRYGKIFELTDPRVMPKAEAAQSVKGFWQPIFARLPFEQAVLLGRGPVGRNLRNCCPTAIAPGRG